MSYPWSSGEILTAANLNALGAQIDRHGCLLTDTAQSFADATLTTVAWGSETFDDNGFHGAGAATLAFVDGGFYIITARLVRASGNWSTGYLRFSLSVGGDFDFAGTGTTNLSGTILVYVNAATTLQVKAYHASGGAVNVDSVCYISRLPELA